jgi:ABC-type dipeptide/oligopeptide/nickel transport system permease subunit
MKASSHEKHAKKLWKKQKKHKKQKVQTHVPSQASPQTLPMGLIFCFFLFLLVFSRFWPNYKKPWKKQKQKKQKVQTHVPCQASPQTQCPWV